MRLIVLCHNQASTGLLIETMNDTGSFLAADSGKGGAMMEQRIHQCVLAMPGTGMNDQPGRFVDDEQVLVFKKNLQRNRLGLIFSLLQRRLAHLDAIPASNRITGPDRLSI